MKLKKKKTIFFLLNTKIVTQRGKQKDIIQCHVLLRILKSKILVTAALFELKRKVRLRNTKQTNSNGKMAMAKEGKDIHNAHTIKVFKNWGRGGVRERKKIQNKRM